MDSNDTIERQDGFLPTQATWPTIVDYLGLFMLVHYRGSPVGAYDEILFSPGKCAFPEGDFSSITKIYVSTMTSVVNGQNNWGIPKEQALFVTDRKHHTEITHVTGMDGTPIAEMKFSLNEQFPWYLFQNLYFTSVVLPGFLRKQLMIIQHWQGKSYQFSFQNAAHISVGQLDQFSAREGAFPDVNKRRIRLVLKLSDFRFSFTRALIKPL
ncbi:hypothetical protein [Endozoicomonas ascidiicola]|uniref:hypothetical protein n=1 Tax=Endozoicomonas ascidiicola TaxID=1698521 RepID=UPI0008371074|nr:hypothetical protein [Endozoicomonas ascidiicola]